MNIRKYADTSPPPEMYDIQAIIHGGIPVTEVEDEYIQEILKDFDIYSVFVKKNNDYYEFKDIFKTKDSIRDIINNVELEILSQLEKWWDKYSKSLLEIEKECVSSETILNRYLKELGYKK